MRGAPETRIAKCRRFYHLHLRSWLKDSALPMVLAAILVATWLGLMSGLETFFGQVGSQTGGRI